MDDFEVEWLNSVHLVGRVTTTGEELELPSGDLLVKFRVVIPRENPATKTTVDTIDCVAISKTTQRKAMKFDLDEIVEIEGALRRRFWKAGAGVASRIEVEVHDCDIL
jgi:single-strand DNA-binding protein